MTARAREALADCERALADYDAGGNTVYQRSRWVALMTLLRTVGLVLFAVDRKVADATTREGIDRAWARLNAAKPEPRIFHEFIDAERQNVVHLYEVRSTVNISVQLGGVSTGGISDPAGPAILDFVMVDGPLKGRDTLDLAREAIQFWRDYLDAIDTPTP